MDKETWMKIIDSFMDDFYKQSSKVFDALTDEDEDRFVSTYADLARSYSKIILRMTKYQILLEDFYKKAEKESTKRILEKVLAPDDSDEVNGFMDIINGRML